MEIVLIYALVHLLSGFHDSWSSNSYNIIYLYDWVMLVLLAVVCVVTYLGCVVWVSRVSMSKFLSSEGLEVIWTVVPVVVLLLLSCMSLRVLYIMEEVSDPDLTVKVVGHQWFWSYESDILWQEFDSYLNPSVELGVSGFRLLEVDKSLALPVGLEARLLVVSEDVIHSWAVPALGVKVDAVPGRLNQLVVIPNRSGILYGQCSEICGAFHAFMPISVQCFDV